MIKVRNLYAGYGGREVLRGMNLEFQSGSMTAVLGPNGSGKTTLVSSISGILRPRSGRIEIEGKCVQSYRPRELAEIMAVLPQKVEPAFGLTVKSMVMMGRYAHGSGFFGYDSQDEAICSEAIDMVGIAHLVERSVSELSGGEFQRVLMARTVAQQARIMVLDEAASGVDVAGKVELFDLLRRMNSEGATIVCVIHDLNLAALYFDRLVFLSEGGIKLDGSPSKVITRENISNVYKTDVAIVEHPVLGVPQVLFLLAAISFAGTVHAELIVIDDFGNKVVQSHPAKRIVALYGSFNEILYAMDLGDRLVARTAADHYPPQILKLPSIGTHMRPNPELIVALKPDLVLQMAGRSQAAAALDPLKARGIPCAMFRVVSFDELFSVIERIGILTGEPRKAAKLIHEMTARLDRVGRKSNGNNRPAVFFEVRYPNLLAAGRGSIVSDIIHKAGGVNCVDNSKKIVRMGEEELLRVNPQNYVYQTGRMNPSPVSPSERPHFRMIRAVHDNKILKVDESVFSRPGPRNVEAVEILADFLFNNKEN